MNKYPNSSIYKLFLNDEIYYGSTTEIISRRFKKHRYSYRSFKEAKTTKKMTAYNLFEKDYDNVKCEVVELFPCNDRTALHIRERYYIENFPCINKLIPTRTREEYVLEHPDKIKASKQKWRDANREQSKLRSNKKTECECGGKYTRANKSVHIKSQKHILFEKPIVPTSS